MQLKLFYVFVRFYNNFVDVFNCWYDEQALVKFGKNMKKPFLLLSLVLFSWASFAQTADELFEEDAVEQKNNAEEERLKIEEEEKRKAAEERAKAEQERLQIERERARVEAEKADAQKKLLLREQKAAADRAKDIEGLREGKADAIEYTIDPSSVEMMVEMDPSNYGFRTRDHRMVLSGDFDFFLRGRAMLRYDFRFFNFLSLSLMGGIDSTEISLYSRFSDKLNKPNPKQFSVLGGVSAKWRLTEWYMNSSVFLEPSVMFGHMWQNLPTIAQTKHWRLRPGAFVGIETVFDSGLSLAFRVGPEFVFDFGKSNPFKELVEPVLMVGLGLAI